MKNKKYTSWNMIKKNKKIQFIQDPILDIEITKNYFGEIYGKMVKKLKVSNNVKTSIEYYLEQHPKKNNTLIFINKDKKNEFYELGMN